MATFGRRRYGSGTYYGGIVVAPPPVDLRLSRLSVEAAFAGANADLRTSRLSVEAAFAGANADLRTSRLSVEVLVRRAAGGWGLGAWQYVGAGPH